MTNVRLLREDPLKFHILLCSPLVVISNYSCTQSKIFSSLVEIDEWCDGVVFFKLEVSLLSK